MPSTNRSFLARDTQKMWPLASLDMLAGWRGSKDVPFHLRELVDQTTTTFPPIVDLAYCHRSAGTDLVRYLCGADPHDDSPHLDQLLVIGTPTPDLRDDDPHAVVQRHNSRARIVYADPNPAMDPFVRALAPSTLDGVVDFVDLDVGEPEQMLADAAEVLDWSRPVGVLFQIAECMGNDQAHALLSALRGALRRGSSLAMLHLTDVLHPQPMHLLAQGWHEANETDLFYRDAEELSALLDGWTLVQPGINLAPWRPPEWPNRSPVDVWTVVARLTEPLRP